jgi:F420-0:gamma-glutamyl ligase
MQQSKELLIKGIKSSIITPGDDLLGILGEALKNCKICEKDVLVISSKVVAVSQGRIRKIAGKADFNKLA